MDYQIAGIIALVVAAFVLAFMLAIVRQASAWGRSGVLFFALCILFSPILAAIILLLIGPARAVSAPATSARPEALRRCPHCAELIQPAARICRYCHSSLLPQAVAVASGRRLILRGRGAQALKPR